MTVCGQCSNLGTKVEESGTEKRKRKKTSSSKSSYKKNKRQKRSSSKSVYDEMDELATDYNKRIQRAREKEDLTQDDLAQEINEKSSLISKLERGDKLPEEKVVKKLENFLDVDLKSP